VIALAVLRAAGSAFWWRTAGYAGLVLIALGIPTVLIPNPIFSRMIEPTWWSYPMWVATAVLAGIVLAARRLPGAACPVDGRAAAGGGLAFLAVACPTCNLFVMTTLGMSGALSIFAPMQPFIGAAGIVLLAATLLRILRLAGQGTHPQPARLERHSSTNATTTSACSRKASADR
jgi:hypothetical protein